MFKQAGLAVLMSAALITSAPTGNAATVLTLEGGFVGMQHIWHFVPQQLQGDLCKSPNHCQPVDYFAFPGGAFTDSGAAKVVQAIDALPDDEQIILFGHSQGGQVVYSDLRRFAADPSSAPDPSRLTWVSIGNPENPYGGRRNKTETPNQWLPPDTAYTGIEVIRQYDGWADWPDDPRNLLAVANAVVGMFSIHVDYKNVDLDDPNNVRFTPEVNGQPGNVTYVWSPTKTLPLVAWAGPLAPALDNALRPIIEKAYHRPVDIPDPTPPSSAAVTTAQKSTAPTKSTGSVRRAGGKSNAKPASGPKPKGTASSARHN
ncbi:pimeloyl-ACP methyl ester carboxylesterase [Mycolicibacterium sp. BK556]|uniref:PE-PPE domain-containing protein n=1 Tax=unclassified Mycolicibacterium TaxID=2636767 RepID=UPI001620367D|nr:MULTISPECIES: PE-PPE domain-containing protein [unclassified Mycolicibacterium]MBB3604622.1 pimeloyl-ACP methyl ester carboxylesterase [Mycolicibacterium sp. BK556]MBB3634665.1 pimeloyl-ACP methyl ester carboxylesterase [Mycolicibacterium sp. BK607]